VAEADKNETKARPDFRSLATFWPYARAQKRRIALALVALVVASLATLVLPLAVRRVIDVGFAGGELGCQVARHHAITTTVASSRSRAWSR